MNKKLVAVAVAGLLAAPLAAQAQTANVTLYGRLNMTMEAVNGQAVDPNITPCASNPSCNVINRTLYRVNSNSSRLGVKGSEALGGGLSAIFQIESGVNADSSGGILASRETFVGLQGSWGTMKIGYFLSPYDDIHPIFGNVPTLTTSILSTAALWAQGSQSNNNGGYDNRNPNSIRYDSPNIKGFTGSMQLSTLDGSPTAGAGAGADSGGSDAQSKRHAYIGSVAGFYNNGPFQGGIAYNWNSKVRGVGLSDSAFSVAANWNFGVVKIGGVFEQLDYDATTSTNLKRNFWGISATAPVGPGELYAFYGDAGDGGGSAANGTRIGQIIKGNSTGAAQWEISYTYALSKRTLAYTGFVQTRNDNNGVYNFNINPISGLAPGANANGFVLGLVHFF